ncbi:MAG: elongator complex protein 3 [Anaerovoracaceae bacterium]
MHETEGNVKPSKKHAIIPVFIAHRGCPHKCVFCNQNEITAKSGNVTPDEVRGIIDTWLSTMDSLGAENIEAAFYGGSFTGIPFDEQTAFLKVAKEYMDSGKIGGIHLSTRPDYIDEKILENLKRYGVKTIELGVQSFDDHVLRLSGRGHDSACVYKACDLIKSYGFRLGIQLMIGLPGDSMESCVRSAEETARIKPDLARLYPTIVLDNTALYDMYEKGLYKPLSRQEAVQRTKEMYRILDDAGIYIMRVGLKSTDIIGDGGVINGGTYHPAFRQLVEGALARDRIEPMLREAADRSGQCGDTGKMRVRVFSNGRWFSDMIGNKAENRKYFAEKFPELDIRYMRDDGLEDGRFRVEAAGSSEKRKNSDK